MDRTYLGSGLILVEHALELKRCFQTRFSRPKHLQQWKVRYLDLWCWHTQGLYQADLLQ
jgi:hypothetical protein